MTTKLPVDKYLKMDLFDELGLKTLSPEERVSFLESFGNVLQQRLTFRVMEELSDEQKDKLDTLLSSQPDNDAALGQFLATEIPNFQSIASEEAAHYKKELVERMKA